MDGSLRLATPADADEVRDIYAPFVESTPVSFETDPPTRAEMADRIERTLGRYPWIVSESDDGDIRGYATAGPLRSMGAYDWTAELTIYVAEDAQQSGIGTALYASLLAVLTEQGYVTAIAAVALPNRASVRLHERHGFEPVGRFPAVGYAANEWRDVQWWHRRLADRSDDPEPPKPLDALRGTTALERALETV